MGRKRKAPKAKIAISLDAKIYDKIVALVDATDRRGGVSGVLEDCASILIGSLTDMEAPELLSSLEMLESERELFAWLRKRHYALGARGEDFEDLLEELDHKISERKQEIELEEPYDPKERRKEIKTDRAIECHERRGEIEIERAHEKYEREKEGL